MAELHIPDDCWDNAVTIQCEFELGHEGKHVAVLLGGSTLYSKRVVFRMGVRGVKSCRIEWEGDDRQETDPETGYAFQDNDGH